MHARESFDILTTSSNACSLARSTYSLVASKRNDALRIKHNVTHTQSTRTVVAKCALPA
jgi:hypothetical protein